MPAPRLGGEGQEPRIPRPPPRDPVAPWGLGGGALSSSRGGGVEGGDVASILRPLVPHTCLPRMTRTKMVPMNTTANMTTTKTKMAVWASSASWGHASGKPPAPEEDDTIWQLRSRFGGNQWYSEWAPLMPSMINRWPKGNAAKSLWPISCHWWARGN